jgi:hypothetical protein
MELGVTDAWTHGWAGRGFARLCVGVGLMFSCVFSQRPREVFWSTCWTVQLFQWTGSLSFGSWDGLYGVFSGNERANGKCFFLLNIKILRSTMVQVQLPHVVRSNNMHSGKTSMHHFNDVFRGRRSAAKSCTNLSYVPFCR